MSGMGRARVMHVSVFIFIVIGCVYCLPRMLRYGYVIVFIDLLLNQDGFGDGLKIYILTFVMLQPFHHQN